MQKMDEPTKHKTEEKEEKEEDNLGWVIVPEKELDLNYPGILKKDNHAE